MSVVLHKALLQSRSLSASRNKLGGPTTSREHNPWSVFALTPIYVKLVRRKCATLKHTSERSLWVGTHIEHPLILSSLSPLEAYDASSHW